jgi:microcompartment protein CcmK/EutM
VLLARILGSVVATRKDPRLEGRKLLVVAPVDPEDITTRKGGALIAVDTVGAGFRETVLIVQGSSARMAHGCNDCPVDASIVGIVDTVDLDYGTALSDPARRNSR